MPSHLAPPPVVQRRHRRLLMANPTNAAGTAAFAPAVHRSGVTRTGASCSAQVPVCARRPGARGRRSGGYEPVNGEISALRPAAVLPRQARSRVSRLQAVNDRVPRHGPDTASKWETSFVHLTSSLVRVIMGVGFGASSLIRCVVGHRLQSAGKRSFSARFARCYPQSPLSPRMMTKHRWSARTLGVCGS